MGILLGPTDLGQRDAFSENFYKVGYTFSEKWYKERVCFEASMAFLHPKSGQVSAPPPPRGQVRVRVHKRIMTCNGY